MTSQKAKKKTKGSTETECRYRFDVDESKCIGCQVCVESCPNDVLETKDGCPVMVQPEACEGCEVCAALCEQEAIKIKEL
ncbi:MAG: 4Fe-4S binding protein [Desulfobacterales bacterium]|jgi:Pyruvate/2-oxoacid:ferredoxin oxidoreductase delta subunit